MTDVQHYVKKQLAEDIERRGGLRAVFSKDRSTQALAHLLDERENIYGKRGSDIRKKIRNLAKRWLDYSPQDYKRRVLIAYKVRSYIQRVRSPSPDSPNSGSSSSGNRSPPPRSTPKKATKLSSPKQEIVVRAKCLYTINFVCESITHTFSSKFPSLISPIQRNIMRSSIGPTEERDVNLDVPIRNGKWTFIMSERVTVDEGEEGDKRMTKLILSTPVLDLDDFMSRRYSVRVNNEGSIIYAMSPVVPAFLIEKCSELHHSGDSETRAGHSAYATLFGKLPEAERREIIAYHMPDGTTVSTTYFNRRRDAAVDADGCFSTHMKTSTIQASYPTPDGGTFDTAHTVVYVELAITESITETKPENLDNELSDSFMRGLNISGSGKWSSWGMG